ncbi:DUF389 domain-containing protein [Candidatus Beckwithbacteria bacterium]|nr:DUF389 domain-containing protein [Candidatus Beckwithbacteria bacterium]
MFLKLPLAFTNDTRDVDEVEVIHKVQTNNQFSFSFLVLLIGSSIVCTLGLLLNTPAVIIGGMLISPLMWPLVKISLGISYSRPNYVKQAVTLLLVAIAITFFSAFAITLISPIKGINYEILARTNPTLLDIFVALVAGGVAALAIVQSKISDSLAGVAIATSLMPPLCVSGIGLALFSSATFLGGLMLFFANVISIIFISVLMFYLVGIKRTSNSQFQRNGLIIVSITLIITALPLILLLKNYTFKSEAYQTTRQVLEQRFAKISPAISLDSVSMSLKSKTDPDAIDIEAEVLVPEDIAIDYQQKEAIIDQLKSALGRNINLNLRIQHTIALVSQEDLETGSVKTQLTKIFQTQLSKLNASLTIDSLSIIQDSDTGVWVAAAVIRADPSIQITENQRSELEQILANQTKQAVELDLEIISRIKLKSQPDLEQDQIKQDIQKGIIALFPNADIGSLALTSQSLESASDSEVKQELLTATLDIKIPKGSTIKRESLDQLKDSLEAKYQKIFRLKLNVTEKNTYLF